MTHPLDTFLESDRKEFARLHRKDTKVVLDDGLYDFLSSRLLEKVREIIKDQMDMGAMASNTSEADYHYMGWENCKHHILSLLTPNTKV